jgi:hypothetical protein
MKRKVTRSKVYRVIRKLLKTSTPEDIASDFLEQVTFEKLLKIFCNQCVFKSHSDHNKARQKTWYGMARLFHRAMDELKLEKEKKSIFKISKCEVYQCKCKKKFYVDPLSEKNCIFEVDRGVVVVTCPQCGKSE